MQAESHVICYFLFFQTLASRHCKVAFLCPAGNKDYQNHGPHIWTLDNGINCKSLLKKPIPEEELYYRGNFSQLGEVSFHPCPFINVVPAYFLLEEIREVFQILCMTMKISFENRCRSKVSRKGSLLKKCFCSKLRSV